MVIVDDREGRRIFKTASPEREQKQARAEAPLTMPPLGRRIGHRGRGCAPDLGYPPGGVRTAECKRGAAPAPLLAFDPFTIAKSTSAYQLLDGDARLRAPVAALRSMREPAARAHFP
jgi:hypothetical protein